MSFQEEDIKLILIGGSTALLLLVSLFLALFIVYNRNLQRRQKEAFRQTLDAIEKERQRIGQDLHDEISPALAGIKMSLNTFTAKLEHDPKALNLLEAQKKALTETVAAVRETTHELSPSGLINDGLISALRKKARLINASPNWQVNIDGDIFPKEASTSSAISIFRIITELTHNSLKHSKGDTINISFSNTSEHAYITYADNGIGINIDETQKLGLGLAGIKTRVGLLGGSILFNPEQEPGFNVSMRFKIASL